MDDVEEMSSFYTDQHLVTTMVYWQWGGGGGVTTAVSNDLGLMLLGLMVCVGGLEIYPLCRTPLVKERTH